MKANYKDFEKEVYKYYKLRTQGFDEAEVEEYFKSDEAQEIIKNEYKVSLKQVENKEITLKQMMYGAAGSVAECLSLMV